MHTHDQTRIGNTVPQVVNADNENRGNSGEGTYRIRLARQTELEKVFKLRHDVFYKEMGASDTVSLKAGLDFDVYDPLCDHLVAVHGSEIVATYRILPVSRALENNLPPYCATEFDVSPLIRKFGNGLVELGRTCVAKNHRNGVVPRLLWKYLLKHILSSGFQGIMGCVSIHNLSDAQALHTRTQLIEGNMWHREWDLKTSMPAHIEARSDDSVSQLTPIILPPLMKAYSGLGAKVCGGPAMDRPFHCSDFLMLAEVSKIPERYLKIFLA